MTSCPTCNGPVDTLRARDVGVRDGKIVAYCSPSCLAAGTTRPTAMPLPPPPVTPLPSRRTPPAGVVLAPGADPEPVSEPVIEIVREPASRPVATARSDASANVPVIPKRVESDRHDLRQLQARAATEDVAPRPNHRGAVIALVVCFLVAACIVLAYWLIHSRKAAAAESVPAPSAAAVKVEPPAPPPAPVPPPISAEAAVARARAVLDAQLASPSPRVVRVAAAALARTGDAAAIARLVDALGHQPSETARLEVAYSIARAADPRGTAALVGALAAPRRDVRIEAARRLALLGDPKAIPVLAEYLEVSQLRLGAAEQLAYVAEPRAEKVLDQVRTDPKASAEDQARATIALGIAGRAEVVPALHELLANTRFNAFAAATLARFHDAAARPLLVKQLAIPSLRVAAARALRELDPALDPRPLLPALLGALTIDSRDARGSDDEPAVAKDTDSVQIAEAILLLAGPASWSARE